MTRRDKEIAACHAASARNSIAKLYENNLALRSLYLLDKLEDSSISRFEVEELFIFTARLILVGLEGVSEPVVISEDIIRFLADTHVAGGNLFAKAVKATCYDKMGAEAEIAWDEFYYFRFLPALRLSYLTSAVEKREMGVLSRIYRDGRASNSTRGFDKNPEICAFPSMLSKYSEAALSQFAAFENLPVQSLYPQIAVTVCGFHRSMMGLGEDARRMFDMLTHLGYRVELFDCSPLQLERDEATDFYETFETKTPIAQVVIFCMPLFEMARVLPKLTVEFFKSRYVVGYWPWELTSFPTGWEEVMGLVDEVWGSSKFLCEVYRRACAKPVYHVPLCVELENLRDVGLASRYISPNISTFISVFDFNSTVIRKNPAGAISAFKLAFSKHDTKANLILKSIHGEMNQSDLNSILRDIADDSRITLIDGPLSKSELNSLIGTSTAFLSLHRSEGFGRLLVEAMLLGTPVIATDWSGSRDFITPENAFPVRFHLRPVGATEYPHAAGEWAEPDLRDAAAIMRRVAVDKALRKSTASSARAFVQTAFSKERVCSVIGERLREICASIAGTSRKGL